MKTIIKWAIKKYVLGIVNESLDRYNVNVDRARAIVARYTGRISALLRFLNSLDAKLADGKLTNDEADKICDEAKEVAKELTA